MNTNGTNPGMNVEDYEDKAIQKSNAAKRIAVGGSVPKKDSIIFR
mgnify:CR=1 FL=1